MDFSQEFLTDVALNAIGYLAAGALMIVIYQIFRKKPAAVANVVGAGKEATPGLDSDNESESVPSADDVEFIQFESENSHHDKAATVESQEIPGRRNRKTVIRLARKMIESGTSHEEIKDLLPVTEAELALLSVSK